MVSRKPRVMNDAVHVVIPLARQLVDLAWPAFEPPPRRSTCVLGADLDYCSPCTPATVLQPERQQSGVSDGFHSFACPW